MLLESVNPISVPPDCDSAVNVGQLMSSLSDFFLQAAKYDMIATDKSAPAPLVSACLRSS